MTYWSATVARMADMEVFKSALNDWIPGRMSEYGATDLLAMQVVLGGEAAGTVQVAFEYPSVDAVLEANAKQAADPDFQRLIQDSGGQLLRRSLLKTWGERGERSGEYATGLYIAHDPLDEDTANNNLDKSWAHMQAGATGIAQSLIVAGGEMTGVTIVLTRTNSMDSLLEASALNFADPEVQQGMAAINARVVGRVVGRALI